MIIARDNETKILTLKEKLVARFEIKDLGKLKYFAWNIGCLFKKMRFSSPKEKMYLIPSNI